MPLTKLVHHKKPLERYRGFERRGYARFPLEQTLRFKIINSVFLKELQIGKAKNISQNGMLFKAVSPPARKSYILIETNQKTLAECVRIDEHLVIMEGKIAGKVMRTHLNLENGLFEIGVRFIHPTERNHQEIEALLKQP